MRTGSDGQFKTSHVEFTRNFDTEPRNDGVHIVRIIFSEKYDFLL